MEAMTVTGGAAGGRKAGTVGASGSSGAVGANGPSGIAVGPSVPLPASLVHV